MSTSSVSFVKKISLIFGRKAYLVYTNNPFPSLLIPLPQIGSPLKSAIYKTFENLSNNQILTFSNKNNHQKELNSIDRQPQPKINIEETQYPQNVTFNSIENIDIKPDSLFLTLNREDHSLSFMAYKDINNSQLYTKVESAKKDKQAKKHQKQEKEQSKQRKLKDQGEKKIEQEKPGDKKNNKAQEFKDQKLFQKQQMSTWNNESPDLSVKDDPRQGQSFLKEQRKIKEQHKVTIQQKINKFVPLAYLTDHIVKKPVEIVHIQTSRQYLLFQLLKFFCLANILCVYGLLHIGTRPQNHNQATK